jgi:hypothetical protein
MLWPLYHQENSPPYPFNLWLNVRLSQFECNGEEKDPSSIGNRNPVLQPELVAIMTEIPQLKIFIDLCINNDFLN